MESASRRVSQLAGHLVPVQHLETGMLGLSNTSSSPNPINDRFHMIHGQVPTHPVTWWIACDNSGPELVDNIYEKSIGEGIAKITINRPERRNAFRPQTIKDLIRAFNDARDDVSIGVIILTGKGPRRFVAEAIRL